MQTVVLNDMQKTVFALEPAQSATTFREKSRPLRSNSTLAAQQSIPSLNPSRLIRVLLVVHDYYEVDLQSIWREIGEMYANRLKVIATFSEPGI